MLNRNAVFEVLNKVVDELNYYLNQVNYEVIPKDDNHALAEKKKSSYNWAFIHDANGNHVFISDEDSRNRILTAERVKNVLAVRKEIMDAVWELKSKSNDDEKACAQTLYDVKHKLENARMTNTYLNSSYKKSHLSYQQNRDLGRSPISSFFHTTWFQSRANKALEKGLTLISDFDALSEKRAENNRKLKK